MTNSASKPASRNLNTKGSNRTIRGPKGAVQLTPCEFLLLSWLMSHANTTLSRTDLLRDVWNWDCADELKTKTVDMQVSRLRAKLKRAGFNPKIISTVRGRGYAYTA